MAHGLTVSDIHAEFKRVDPTAKLNAGMAGDCIWDAYDIVYGEFGH